MIDINKDLRAILSKYTAWLLKKGIINHPTHLVDYEIAETYLESEASKCVRDGFEESVVEEKETKHYKLSPELLDTIINYIEYAESRIEEEWGSGRGFGELIKEGEVPDFYNKLLELRKTSNCTSPKQRISHFIDENNNIVDLNAAGVNAKLLRDGTFEYFISYGFAGRKDLTPAYK